MKIQRWPQILALVPLGFSLACLGIGGGSKDAEDAGTVVGGAGPGSLPLPFGAGQDSDGDGLSNSEEAALGTDPNNPDSDGDGWQDGDEVAQYTDPTKANDHPYTGGWRIGACRDDLNGQGQQLGDIADNFKLSDQYGDKVRLHDFCDREVLLVSAAFW